MTLSKIDTSPALNGLADRILDPGRRNTIIVLSVRSRNHVSGFDPYEVTDGVKGTDVDVALLTDPWYGNTLSNLVNGKLTAFNGAASVVPAYGAARTFLPDRDSVTQIVDKALEHARYTGGGDLTTADPSMEREIRRLRRENNRLKGQIKRSGGDLQDTEQQLPAASLFPPGMHQQWLDLSIRVAWAFMTGPGDKLQRPLPDHWSYADAYPGQAARCLWADDLIRCMTRILLGLDEGHALHDGSNGAPIALGEWGRTIWRSCVKQGSPNAPRIHWTRDDANDVVFLDFGGHDDLI